MRDVPRKFRHWTLLDEADLPDEFQELGELNFEGRHWKICRGNLSMALFVITDFDRSDDPVGVAIYKLDTSWLITELCDHLVNP